MPCFCHPDGRSLPQSPADFCPYRWPDFAPAAGKLLPSSRALICLPAIWQTMPFAMAKSCPNNLAAQFIPISMHTAMLRQMYSSWQKLSFAMTILAPPHHGHDLPLYKTGKKLPAPTVKHCRFTKDTLPHKLPPFAPFAANTLPHCHPILATILPLFCRLEPTPLTALEDAFTKK